MATSLLVLRGQVLDAVCTEYTYQDEAYVWPFVKEHKEKRTSHDRIAPAHLTVMEALLQGYTGICNFNYKLRAFPRAPFCTPLCDWPTHTSVRRAIGRHAHADCARRPAAGGMGWGGWGAAAAAAAVWCGSGCSRRR